MMLLIGFRVFGFSFRVLCHLCDVKALAGLVPAKKKFDGLCVHVKKTDDCCSTWKATKSLNLSTRLNGQLTRQWSKLFRYFSCLRSHKA